MAKKPKAATFIKDPLWYKDAVIYQVHVKSFFDSNNDGIGDFPGLIAKLDYIADLGVNTIWLLPFYPSPRRDDGYDIAEYRGVHSDYGTMADAKRFIAEALAASGGPIVAASDFVRAYPDLIRNWVPRRYTVLGTDGFGRSDTRAGLRDFFEVDARYIALAALQALANEGTIDGNVVSEALTQLGINKDKPCPFAP